MVVCNLCGSQEFVDIKKRKGVRCAKCGSLERTRLMALVLESLGIPKPSSQVLFLAPEWGLYRYLSSKCQSTVITADIDVERYRRRYPDIRQVDLCQNMDSVADRHYDLVVHSHVLEHVPCNYTVALKRLNDLLDDGGYHVCCIPIAAGYFDEYLGTLAPEEAVRRFGQANHVRRFGSLSLLSTLGQVIPLNENYDLTEHLSAVTLTRHNIPEYCWKGYTPHSILTWRKEDFLF